MDTAVKETVAARGMIEQAPAAPASPEDIVVGKLIDQRAAGVTDRGLLESFRERGKSERETGKAARDVIDKEITDAADKSIAEQHNNLIVSFLNDEYDGITDPDMQLVLRTNVEDVIRSWPAARVIFDAQSPAEQQDALEKMLKDPEFRKHVKDKYDNLFNPKDPEWKKELPKRPEEDEGVEQARNEWQTKENAVLETINELNKFQTELQNARQDEGDFRMDTTTTPPTPVGPKAIDLQAKISHIDGLGANYRSIRSGEYDANAKQISRYNDLLGGKNLPAATIGTYNGEITRLIGIQNRLDSEIAAYDDLIKVRNEIIAARDAIPTRITEAENGIHIKEQELLTESRQEAIAQADYEKKYRDVQELLRKARIGRTDTEKVLIENLGSVFQDATEQWIEAYLTNADSQIEDITKDVTDKFQKEVVDAINKRMDASKGKRMSKRGIHFKRNEEVHTMYKDLLNPNKTLREQVEKLMMDSDPRYKTIDPATGDEVLSDEAKNILNLDKNFAKKLEAQVAMMIIHRRMQSGGITTSEGEELMQKSWYADCVKTLSETNPDFAKQIQEEMKKAHFRKSPAEWMASQAGKKSVWMLLMIAFGGIPGFIIGRSVLKSATEGAAH